MLRFRSQNDSGSGQLDLDPVEAVLFDLDGTLIEVDMQRFIPAYLQRLTAHLKEYGEPRRIAATIRAAVVEMLTCSTGQRTMEEILLHSLANDHGIDRRSFQGFLEKFIQADLPDLQGMVRRHPAAAALLEACRENGWQLVVATNPIFPRRVVEARLAWAGLDQVPFRLITAYETARYCKPHPEFFGDILRALACPADVCLMVGNDTEHDLAAARVGLQTCLLSTWRIDRLAGRYQANWEGSHEALLARFRGREAPTRPTGAGGRAD